MKKTGILLGFLLLLTSISVADSFQAKQDNSKTKTVKKTDKKSDKKEVKKVPARKTVGTAKTKTNTTTNNASK